MLGVVKPEVTTEDSESEYDDGPETEVVTVMDSYGLIGSTMMEEVEEGLTGFR